MNSHHFDNLIEPAQTTALMKELGLDAKKRFGQNFLIDARVLDKIIKGAEITKDDTVLEIGPGVGTMTQALSRAAGKVIAVEIASQSKEWLFSSEIITSEKIFRRAFSPCSP